MVLQRMSGFNYRYKVRKYFTDLHLYFTLFSRNNSKFAAQFSTYSLKSVQGSLKQTFFKAGQHLDILYRYNAILFFSLNKTYRCFFSNMALLLYKLTCTTLTFRHAVLLIIQHIIIAIKKYLEHECKTYCMKKSL